jgi:hypothetical protein
MKPKAAVVLYEPPLTEGVWLPPREACKYFRHGQGIAYKSLMTRIYSGKLKKFAKWTPGGWYVFITNDMLNTHNKTA